MAVFLFMTDFGKFFTGTRHLQIIIAMAVLFETGRPKRCLPVSFVDDLPVTVENPI
jgi:hypothetical protein